MIVTCWLTCAHGAAKRRPVCIAVGAAIWVAAGLLPAQQVSPHDRAHDRALDLAIAARTPGIRFETTGKSAKAWPMADASPTVDGFMTVVAITPSTRGFAVQLLYPTTPLDSGYARRDAVKHLAAFDPGFISHRVATGGGELRPVVVGFYSPTRPRLDALARGAVWARDAFVQTPVDSTTDFAEVFATMAYAASASQATFTVYRETRARPGGSATCDDAPRPVLVGTPKNASVRGGPSLLTTASAPVCGNTLARTRLEVEREAERQRDAARAAEAERSMQAKNRKPPGSV